MPIALGLAAVAAALLGLLLIAGARPFAQVLADALGQVPGIGGQLQRAVNDAMLGAIGRLVVWSEQSAQGLAQAISAPIVSLWTMVDALVTEDWQIVGAIYTLATYSLPNLRLWVWNLVDGNTRWLLALLIGDVDWLKQYVYDTAQWILTWAQGEFASELAYVEYVKLSLWQAIGAWVDILVKRMDAGDIEAGRYAEALAGRAIAYADSIGARDLRVIDQVGSELAARMDAEVGRTIDYERTVADALLRDIVGAEARANAYAAALAVPIAAAVTAIEESPCMRYCSSLGELGQMLQGLQEAGLLAAMLALAGEAAHDAQGTGRELAKVLGPLTHDLAVGARETVGV